MCKIKHTKLTKTMLQIRIQKVMKYCSRLINKSNYFVSDLEPKMKRYHKTKLKVHRTTIMKLKYLKFALTNLVNSIQHYIFSFIFTKCLKKFELDFEKANDLSSIMMSHAEFISTVNSMITGIRTSDKDFAVFASVSIYCILKSIP